MASDSKFDDEFRKLISQDKGSQKRTSRVYRKNDFNLYENKTITDYLCLDIEKDKILTHKSIKTNLLDKIGYSLKGRTPHTLKRLQPQYLKPKEDFLEGYVTRDSITEIHAEIASIKQSYDAITRFNSEIAGQLNLFTEAINLEKIIDSLNENSNPQENKRSPKTFSFKRNNGSRYTHKEAEKDFWNKNDSRKIIVCYNSFDTSGNPRDTGKYHGMDLKGFDEMRYDVAHQLSSFFGDVKTDVMQGMPFMAIETDSSSTRNILEILNSRKFNPKMRSSVDRYIKYVEPDQFMSIPTIFKEDCRTQNKLWNLENIGAYEAQKMYAGKGIKVGIIDTGVDYDHMELFTRFNKDNLGYDFIENDSDPFDENGHGTHVAGTVAGSAIGVAPEASLYGVRVLDASGGGTSYTVMQGINWCSENKMDIANLSLGGGGYLQSMQDLCTYATQRGLNIVAAAGNSGMEEYHYPASYDDVIAVAAVDRNNDKADFSTYNDTIDIAAPGVKIYSSIPHDGYDTYSGTSMATPHVSGTLALAIQSSMQAPPEIERKMKSTAKDIGDKLYFGAGLIKADKIIK